MRRAAVVTVLGTMAFAGAAHAAPLGGARIVGTSCRYQFESRYVSTAVAGGTGRVQENHVLDGAFTHLDVTSSDTSAKVRRYDVRWTLAAGVTLCRSRVKVGGGKGVAITTTTGAFSVDVPPKTAVRVEVRGYVAGKPRLKPHLGEAAVRSLVAGWGARSCTVKHADPDAAALLADLVARGHGSGCRGPDEHHAPPSAADLLKHLTAVFNAARGASEATGREYYRVLGQLAVGVPTLPA